MFSDIGTIAAIGPLDERGFDAARRIRRAHGNMPWLIFKTLVREQFNMRLIDENAALAAIPSITARRGNVSQALGTRRGFSAEDRRRMSEVARLFAVDDEWSGGYGYLRQGRLELQAKAS